MFSIALIANANICVRKALEHTTAHQPKHAFERLPQHDLRRASNLLALRALWPEAAMCFSPLPVCLARTWRNSSVATLKCMFHFVIDTHCDCWRCGGQPHIDVQYLVAESENELSTHCIVRLGDPYNVMVSIMLMATTSERWANNTDQRNHKKNTRHWFLYYNYCALEVHTSISLSCFHLSIWHDYLKLDMTGSMSSVHHPLPLLGGGTSCVCL